MKYLLTRRKSLIATALLGLSAVAAAQSVGPVRGSAQVGRPLELSVPVRFDRADADDGCAQARVFYGDTRVEPAHVSTQVLQSDLGATLAVRSRAAVNEPFVTVEVRAGCASTTTRTFVLLTEPAGNELPIAIATSPLPDTRSIGAAAAGTRVVATRERVASGRIEARAERAVPVRTAAVRTAKATPPAATGKDQLRMAVWSPSIEQGTMLRMATRLSSPAEDAARRAAAAAIWQALSAEPQDLQRSLQELRGLQSEVQLLRTSAARSRAEAAGLREQVAKKSAFELPGWLPWAAALLLAAAAAGFAWRRGRSTGPAKWYAALGDSVFPSRFDAQPPAPMDTEPSGEVAEECKPEAGAAVPASLPVTQKELAQAGLPASRAAALASLVQEVEFLESLGLVKDAVAALKEYVQDAPEPPPVVYLELLRLCARHRDEAGLAAARAHWHRSFGSEAPELSRIEAGDGIEAHPTLLSRITAQWPTAAALEIIDTRLFGHPLPDEDLSLQAWRDLLWLHSMAEAMSREEVQATGSRDALDAAPWMSRDAADPVRAELVQAEEVFDEALDFDIGVRLDPQVAPRSSPLPVASSDEDETRPRAPVVKPLPPLDWAGSKPKEKQKDLATYEDFFDAVSASEGKWAHR